MRDGKKAKKIQITRTDRISCMDCIDCIGRKLFCSIFTIGILVSTLAPTLPSSLLQSLVTPISSVQKIAYAQALRSTRLDVKLIDAKSRIVSPTVVESVFQAKIRAYGGDIYLPAYREDMVYGPIFIYPMEGSNAVIPGTATIKVVSEQGLDSDKGRYILKEYESADITITTTSKIIPEGIVSSRIIFKNQLNTIIWKPVIQEFNEDEVGNPLLEVTTLEWQTNPVIIYKQEGESIITIMSSSTDQVIDPAANGSPLNGPMKEVGMSSNPAIRKLQNVANIFLILKQILKSF